MIHVTPLDFTLWFSELALELIAFWYAFRLFRGKWPLWAFFAFRGASDIVCFLIYFQWGQKVANTAGWYQIAAGYALQFFLCICLCGEILGEDRKQTTRSAAVLTPFAAGVIGLYFRQPLLLDRLLKTELACLILIGGLIAISWFDRGKPLEQPWKGIAAGMLTLTAVQFFGSVLQARFAHAAAWDVIARLFPVGHLAAGVIFWQAVSGKLSGFRRSLSPRGEQLPEIESKGAVN